MHADLEVIQEWIPTSSHVLSLGCGDGELLAWLRDHKQISSYGLEIDPDSIARCVKNGANVIEQDLDKGLGSFASGSFDVVVMTQAPQAVYYPDRILEEMLRVGKTCIITLPNFGHWRCRWYLARNGRIPVSEFLSYTWYNTPNIRFCTFQDFECLCCQLRMRVLDRLAVDHDHRHGRISRLWPNLLGEIGIYRATGPGVQTRNLVVQERARLRAGAGHPSARPRGSAVEAGQGRRQQTMDNVRATFQEKPPCAASPLSSSASA